MHNNILVPDYSLPPSGYKPLYLYDEMDLINYLVSQQISPEFRSDVIDQLIQKKGILTRHYVFFCKNKPDNQYVQLLLTVISMTNIIIFHMYALLVWVHRKHMTENRNGLGKGKL